MKIGNKEFFKNPSDAFIMGILNVTPDSFSDGGKWNNLSIAIDHTADMIRDGADIIDIGGESTRPGHTQISVDEELERILPVIEALKSRFDVPLSIDCYRSETARVAIDAGADMINDIWGLQYDPQMASLIAESGVSYCLMHNRKDGFPYVKFPEDVLEDMRKQLHVAADAGIAPSQIIIDPGIGFAKSRDEEVILIHSLSLFEEFNLPILLGTSRKRIINSILNVPPEQRDVGTAATTVYGYMKGARIFRVHNVRVNKEALDVAIALERSSIGLH